MGVKLTDIFEPTTISFEELAHNIIAVDAYNILYQFITTIRQRDGTPLKNSKGDTTSHLVGLFSRATNFLEHQIQPVFIYDGKTPELKKKELDRRKRLKKDAADKHAEAEAKGDTKAMRKYAGRTAKLTPRMVKESQDLLDALGIPWMTAPAEAEAQAALIVKNGDADYVASQDNDSLLFGAPKMLKNLSISGRRKRPGTNSYYTIEPQVITLAQELERLQLTQEQLVLLGMLVGTDFNPKGIHGIGPKRGLEKVKEYGTNKEALFEDVEWDEHNDVAWQDVYELITNMPTSDDYDIQWGEPSEEQLRELLVEKFEFTEERVIGRAQELARKRQQKGLREYF